jgi:hypothetical protein
MPLNADDGGEDWTGSSLHSTWEFLRLPVCWEGRVKWVPGRYEKGKSRVIKRGNGDGGFGGGFQELKVT